MYVYVCTQKPDLSGKISGAPIAAETFTKILKPDEGKHASNIKKKSQERLRCSNSKNYIKMPEKWLGMQLAA
jgi:hypothetical protein